MHPRTINIILLNNKIGQKQLQFNITNVLAGME